VVEQWLREEADQRVHGTVHEVVGERFAREAPALRPLPARRYDTAYWERRKVGWDAYVEVRGNRYSVPAESPIAAANRPSRMARSTPSAQVRATNTSSTYAATNPARRITVFAYIRQQSRGR